MKALTVAVTTMPGIIKAGTKVALETSIEPAGVAICNPKTRAIIAVITNATISFAFKKQTEMQIEGFHTYLTSPDFSRQTHTHHAILTLI